MHDTSQRRIGELTVRIDRLLCVGFEDCVELAPEVFDMDEDGVCTFKQDLTGARAARLTEACRACPVDALVVFRADGSQIVP